VHAKSAIKRNKRYKKMAALFNTAIPLTSLALTILATSEFEYQHAITAAVAISLTVITGINYTLEPGRRYTAYANICIELHDALFRLETGVEQRKADPADIMKFLDDANAELSAIGRVMIGLPVAKEKPA
jgi:hypothetical protein